MSLFGKLDIAHLIEKAMEHIDMKAITAEVMQDLQIDNLELYFVVREVPYEEPYEFVGMAYSQKSANLMRAESSKRYPCKVFKLDLGKLAAIMESMGALEEVG